MKKEEFGLMIIHQVFWDVKSFNWKYKDIQLHFLCLQIQPHCHITISIRMESSRFNEHYGNAIAFYDVKNNTLVEYHIPTKGEKIHFGATLLIL